MKKKKPTKTGKSDRLKSSSPKRSRQSSNRRYVAASPIVMVLLDNPNGLRWVMEFAPIYASILHGIETGLREQGKRMQACSLRSGENLEELIRAHPPDGFLFLASKRAATFQNIIGALPCISVLGQPCDGIFDSVSYDNPATGRLPAEYFLSRGLKKLAILGPIEQGSATTFGVRYQSFKQTVEEGGGQLIELLSNDLYEPSNPSNAPRPDTMKALIQSLKQGNRTPEALFVMADNLIHATYFHLQQEGFKPGIDFPVISCNAEKPFLAGLEPQPGRVELQAEEIGRRAVTLLEFRRLNPDTPTSVTLFPPKLHPPQN